jgi:lipid A 3-O-deacylase
VHSKLSLRSSSMPVSAPVALRHAWPAAVLLALACAAPASFAQEADAGTSTGEPRRFFIDGARAAGDVGLASVGVQLPWHSFRRSFLGTELTGHWDAHIAHWRAPASTAASDRRHWTQVALVPTLRLRFRGGESAWFMEGGIGLSVLDGYYATRHKRFSTRFNFTDHQGFGFNFGANRQHEVMLILRHVSNGGIRKPNPGEDFVQLRYSHTF